MITSYVVADGVREVELLAAMRSLSAAKREYDKYAEAIEDLVSTATASSCPMWNR